MSANAINKPYKPQYFLCPMGLIAHFCSLKLTAMQQKVLAHIVELYGAHNYDKTYSVAVAISTSEFKKAVNSKSNRAIQDAIKKLSDKKLIEVQAMHGATAKYKVLDTELYPYKKIKKGG
jgi:SOS-response transcriptional repressor LexA